MDEKVKELSFIVDNLVEIVATLVAHNKELSTTRRILNLLNSAKDKMSKFNE